MQDLSRNVELKARPADVDQADVGLVTVPWMYLHSTKNFDSHKNHFKLMKDLLLPPLDRAFSALLEDFADRRLLDETLVVWTGEFGRTPKINKASGRDHWGQVYSTVLAGGGIQGGRYTEPATTSAVTLSTIPCIPATSSPQCTTPWATAPIRESSTRRAARTSLSRGNRYTRCFEFHRSRPDGHS